MDKKKIFIIGGVVLALGVGFYFWNKSKNATGDLSGGADGGNTPADSTTKNADGTPVDGTSTESTPANQTASTKAPLTNRKEKKKACGRKPVLKNKKAEWQKCVDAGGVASFEGDNSQWKDNYMDFEGLQLDL